MGVIQDAKNYQAAVSGFFGSLTDADYEGFSDRASIEKRLRERGIWQDSGMFNSNNEKLVDSIWQKSELMRPVFEEKKRLANEAQLAAQTKKQQEARAAQKTKQNAYQGRRGTIVTGPQGVVDPVDQSGRKTLLGA
jgi:hypothetical protein